MPQITGIDLCPSVLIRGSALVIETTLHLPVSQVKLSLSAAANAGSIGPALPGKRPAELRMPATKHSNHQIADFSGQGRRIDVSGT